jgi:hypothetical protein
VEDDTNIQELFVEKWEEWCKLNGSQQKTITSIDLFLFAYPKEKEKLDQFARLLVWYGVVKRMLVIKVYQQEIYEWFRELFYSKQ